jgi:hypothetical protein
MSNQKWESELKAAKATQVAFDLSLNVQRKIKRDAVDEDFTPSDMIRKVLGLEVRSRKKRQRLTLSLSAEDIDFLAKQYGIDAEDSMAIKKRAAQALIDYAEANDGN